MENMIATLSEIASVKKGYDIAFPNLGIFITTLKNTIKVGNFTIAYYGIIIALAMFIAFLVVTKFAKKSGMDDDVFYDLFILIIVLGIIGARAYYVLFNLDYYSLRPYEILDVRAGGLAVFGGIILSIIGITVYCKIKKCNLITILDIAIIGLPLGQAIGRFGNFFNMEAYGTYTNNLLAMRMNMKYLDRANIDLDQTLNMITEDGIEYIQAHPTFLYESVLNIILFVVLVILFKKFYKFKGELFASYLIGYGIIRAMIESLRTDSLMLGEFKISQIVAIFCVILGISIYIINFILSKKKECSVEFYEEKKDEAIDETKIDGGNE